MTIHFYEKPGCINNTKQKKMLDTQGHSIIAHSLLDTPWTKECLRPFFGSLPVEMWFNSAAPRVKSGEITPNSFDEESALLAMIEDPLLICRPLIDAEGVLVCGFDNELVHSLLQKIDISEVQTCPKMKNDTHCE